MTSSTDAPKDDNILDAHLAQISEAWIHIAKGEKTADVLEANLTSLERKLDELLKSFEDSGGAEAEAESSGVKKVDEQKEAKEKEKASGESATSTSASKADRNGDGGDIKDQKASDAV